MHAMHFFGAMTASPWFLRLSSIHFTGLAVSILFSSAVATAAQAQDSSRDTMTEGTIGAAVQDSESSELIGQPPVSLNADFTLLLDDQVDPGWQVELGFGNYDPVFGISGGIAAGSDRFPPKDAFDETGAVAIGEAFVEVAARIRMWGAIEYFPQNHGATSRYASGGGVVVRASLMGNWPMEAGNRASNEWAVLAGYWVPLGDGVAVLRGMAGLGQNQRIDRAFVDANRMRANVRVDLLTKSVVTFAGNNDQYHIRLRLVLTHDRPTTSEAAALLVGGMQEPSRETQARVGVMLSL